MLNVGWPHLFRSQRRLGLPAADQDCLKQLPRPPTPQVRAGATARDHRNQVRIGARLHNSPKTRSRPGSPQSARQPQRLNRVRMEAGPSPHPLDLPQHSHGSKKLSLTPSAARTTKFRASTPRYCLPNPNGTPPCRASLWQKDFRRDRAFY